jgi:hypothetical protein
VTVRDIFAGVAGFVTSIGQWFNEGLLTLVYGDFLDLTVGQFIFTSLIVYLLYLFAKHTVIKDFLEDFKGDRKGAVLSWIEGGCFIVAVVLFIVLI